jgi:hypothetical protein
VVPGQPGVYVPGQPGGYVPGQPGGYVPGTGSAGVGQQPPLTVTLTTSGIWSSVVEESATVSYLNGIGTNQISWGIPYNTQGFQSAYRFDSAGTVSLPLDGSYFVLGTFTHFNYSIYGYTIRAAYLRLILNVNGTNVEFNFLLSHNETPNEGVNGVCPLTPGYAPPCPDVVSILNAQSQETVVINGKQYVLYILGFFQNGQMSNQFITFEDQVNSAQIFGQLVETNQLAAIPVAGYGNFNPRLVR